MEAFVNHVGPEWSGISPAVRALLKYLNDPKYLKLHLEDINRLMYAVTEEDIEETAPSENYRRLLEQSERTRVYLQTYLEQNDATCSRLRKERNDLKTELARCNSDGIHNASIEYEAHVQQVEGELKQLRKEMNRKNREEENRMRDLEATSDEIIKDQQRKIHRLERNVKERDLKMKRLEILENKKYKYHDKSDILKQLDNSENELHGTRDRLQEVLAHLKETENELDVTKTRLSKAMRDKLTYNNPNIADLSDANRPTKLAERFAELYSNQWTDAFEVLDVFYRREENTIQALLAIIQDTMTFCENKAHVQMEELQCVLAFSDDLKDGSLPQSTRKQLQDCRKSMFSIVKRSLHQMYISHLKRSSNETFVKALDVRSYVKKCIELCWLMAIQDPPVVFGPMAQRGILLNTDVYQPYTRSGIHVDYVVWPALLLHDGGPVLAKGVAQGFGEKAKGTQCPISARKTFQGTEADTTYSHGRYATYNSNRNTPSPNNISSAPVDRRAHFGINGDIHTRTRSADANNPIYTQTTRTTKTIYTPTDVEGDITDSELARYFDYIRLYGWNGLRDMVGEHAYEKCLQYADKIK